MLIQITITTQLPQTSVNDVSMMFQRDLASRRTIWVVTVAFGLTEPKSGVQEFSHLPAQWPMVVAHNA